MTEIYANYINKINKQVSVETIRNTLRRNGFVSRVKRKRQLLEPKHINQRLEFAKKYINWTVNDWKRIIWSDESKFLLFGSNFHKYYWTKPCESIKISYINPVKQFSGSSIMVKSCI